MGILVVFIRSPHLRVVLTPFFLVGWQRPQPRFVAVVRRRRLPARLWALGSSHRLTYRQFSLRSSPYITSGLRAFSPFSLFFSILTTQCAVFDLGPRDREHQRRFFVPL